MSYDVLPASSHHEATRHPRSPDRDDSAEGDNASFQDTQNQIGDVRRRRRIPRACESCRKRKIRCDGNEVCGGCHAGSIMCVYRDVEGARLMKEHVQQLDTRLQKMESMLTNILTKFETSQSTKNVPGQIDASNEGMNEIAFNDAPGPADDFHCPPSPPLSHVQCIPNENNRHSNDFNRNVRHSKRRKIDHRRSRRPTYADAYGELHPDEWGQLRYIGLSSTMSVIDICMPFREHINRGLEQKGYDNHNNFLGPAPSICEAMTPQSTDHSSDIAKSFVYGQIPSLTLVNLLLPGFYDRMYFILPVMARSDFDAGLANLNRVTGQAALESDFLPVLYALLAVAALNTPKDILAFENDESLDVYRDMHLGANYFALSTMCHPLNAQYCGVQNIAGQSLNRLTPPYPRRSLNPIITLILQAAYLSAIGSQAEAWILIRQAVGLGQDLGLHRSAAQLGFSSADQERRRYAWWCIYSLDRALSAALGRPLGIRDADCDVELPWGDENTDGHDSTGFVAILNLRRILGDILTTVASVRTVKAGRHVSKTREMESIVVGLHTELQTWASKEVPDPIKTATEGQLCVEKFIALSGHFCALLLLYRFFMGNPHRPSPLRDNEALFQCARAATNCIRITDKMINLMPICADLVFHTQHVFTSSVILLQCIRRSDDANFIQEALTDVEQALRSLRQLQQQWPGATRLTATVEEYVEFTLKFIENGMAGRCVFHPDMSEFTGLEIRDGSGRFPSDWAQLAFKRLPIASGRRSQRHPVSHDQDKASTPFRDQSLHLRSRQASTEADNNISLNHTSLPSLRNAPSAIVNGADPGLFRFALPPNPSSASMSSTSTANTPALNDKPRSRTSRPAPTCPPPSASHQLRYQAPRDDDPTRSWSIGVADSSFENLLATGMDTSGDMLLDNAAYFASDAFWSFQ